MKTLLDTFGNVWRIRSNRRETAEFGINRGYLLLKSLIQTGQINTAPNRYFLHLCFEYFSNRAITNPRNHSICINQKYMLFPTFRS